jgi:hypothetical protein
MSDVRCADMQMCRCADVQILVLACHSTGWWNPDGELKAFCIMKEVSIMPPEGPLIFPAAGSIYYSLNLYEKTRMDSGGVEYSPGTLHGL